MTNTKRKKYCGLVRPWLAEALNNRMNAPATWLRKHIAECPRCRRVVLGGNRLRVAFLLLKTQPHRSDLLAQANSRAITVLKRSLRDLPQAQKLRRMSPRPNLLQRLGKYKQGAFNAAACLVVLLLMKAGILSAMMKFHDEGTQVAQRYYARYLDQDIMDDLQ